ncbi:CBS-domain-containing membrane protein [Kitasatospora sp. MAP12-15]|uniref:CBS domain-containing protein n=1 Tax=unclassified Kitasatospora TaxID=2633591 RepID=UPI002475B359|nr:hypothetical protein [Kitasatospora sp. MAP12-44]MDH6112298.1 CBS-domain-containing membrane protein [Kitasatospora sp. MAP12-44]
MTTTITPRTSTRTSTPPAAGHYPTAAEAMDRPQHQIADDVLVDKALEILCDAGADYLPVRGGDGRFVGLVTRVQLAPYLPRSWYTERTPVRAVIHERGAFGWPEMAIHTAVEAMRVRGLEDWPMVDDDGYLVGVLNLERAEAMAAAADLPSIGMSIITPMAA